MPEKDGSSSKSGSDGTKAGEGTLTVGDKTYGVKDVENLIAMQKSATEKTQTVAEILGAAEKYKISPAEYLSQSEGAFAVISQLIDEGVIDQQGKLVKKTGSDEGQGTKSVEELIASLQGTAKLDGQGEPTSEDKMLGVINKALKSFEDGISKRLEGIENTQSDQIRLNVQDRLKLKHKDLTDDDVSKVFGLAMNDRKKSVWQHAEDVAKEREGRKADLRKGYAKEFGVNLEEFDRNKLKEQDAKGGASAIFPGKKFSFRNKGEGFVDPGKAAGEFLEHASKGQE